MGEDRGVDFISIDGGEGGSAEPPQRPRMRLARVEEGVRDVDELEAMNFPVFATTIHARGTVKETLGSVNIPVTCANATVHPGDVVVGDTDGVVVVPRAKVADVVEASKARETKEAGVRQRLATGELGLDVYGMREKLATKGLQYKD